MRNSIALGVLIGATAILVSYCDAAIAQDSNSYWVSMRDMTVGPPESFVTITTTANAQQNVPMNGCDGNTYYIASGDAQTVQNALANNDTVQMNVTPSGQQPDDSAPIICVIQASQ